MDRLDGLHMGRSVPLRGAWPETGLGQGENAPNSEGKV